MRYKRNDGFGKTGSSNKADRGAWFSLTKKILKKSEERGQKVR